MTASRHIVPYGSASALLEPSAFVQCLLQWYATHRRNLPWRITNDPYAIWLSEVLLQQTQVAQSLPYYQRFMMRYPRIHDLAQAEEQEVLSLFQGLGYYRRARKLHACARHVVSQHGGEFPANYQELLKLPGIGPYTAAAVASIAFQEPVAVVDGNVYRVLARLFGLLTDITSTRGKKSFQVLAQSLVPKQHPGLYNQALMEFGALWCKPKRPLCATCVLQPYCVAYHTHQQYALPVKARRTKVKDRFLHYFVLTHGDKTYMRKRQNNDIWRAMYDFYTVEHERHLVPFKEDLKDPLVSQIKKYQIPVVPYPVIYKHQLTHQRLYCRFFCVEIPVDCLRSIAPLLEQAELYPFDPIQIRALPKPVLISRFLQQKALRNNGSLPILQPH